MVSASIWPSNVGISKLTCTLKGVAPPEWWLGEDVSLVGSRLRIWENLSIVSLYFHMRYSLRNSLMRSPTPLSFFSFVIGVHQGQWGWSFKGSSSLIPNSLYPDLNEDKHRKTNKVKIIMIPLIHI